MAWPAPRRRPSMPPARCRAARGGCPTPPAPTFSSSWPPATARPSRWSSTARRSTAVKRYDATRSLGHVTLDGVSGTVVDVGAEVLANAWYLAQALLAAESVGTVETCLEMAVAYAKERFTFGRAIGSYQAVKHSLTEILRRQENARSLLLYAGWAAEDKPEEFPIAASAARSAAGSALDHAARTNIAVHGGIGATWEHDAPLFFRRAELTERLLGGTHDATDRVAAELIATAGAAA